MEKKKIVLAYSGGLDTSCCLRWLQDKGFDVVCFSANLGSEFSPKELRKKAREAGVSRIHIKDLSREFLKDYILPSLKAGALYQKKYLLSTALGRPLIAKHLVEVARQEEAGFVAHGCSAKGNDQIRLELAIKALAPDLKIIAPLRIWDLASREDEIEYAKKNRIATGLTGKKIYSIDKNIWGTSIEAGLLEDLNNSPPENAFLFTKSPEKASNRKETVEIEIKAGVPVQLNRKKLSLKSLVEKLNVIGGKHGIGRTDLVEDRVVGIKSREVYEAPAAWILHKAFRELEELVFSKELLDFKEIVAGRYSNLVYRGFWFSELKESLDAFLNEHVKKLSGKIIFQLYKGNITTLSRSSRHSLYEKGLATYGKEDIFCRDWAEGFINILGLPIKRGEPDG